MLQSLLSFEYIKCFYNFSSIVWIYTREFRATTSLNGELLIDNQKTRDYALPIICAHLKVLKRMEMYKMRNFLKVHIL